MSTSTFTPPEPDASLYGFQSETNTIHLLGSQAWGPNPQCSSKFSRGHVVSVLQKEISCKKCQASLVANHA